MDKRVRIILIVLTILTFSIFIIYNTLEFCKKDDIRNSNNTTTTKVQENVSEEDLIDDKLTINGENKDIKVIEIVSHLGFNLRYQSSLFSMSRLSNGALKLSHKDDEDNYVLIEKLQENEYYKEYNELNKKEYVKDSYLISYKFLKGNVLTYLKITKSINVETQKYEEINANLDYIISSLTLTS